MNGSRSPQRAWRLTVYAQKGPTHPLLVAESDIARDHLMSYGANLPDASRKCGIYVGFSARRS
jgi:hypothetical protein